MLTSPCNCPLAYNFPLQDAVRQAFAEIHVLCNDTIPLTSLASKHVENDNDVNYISIEKNPIHL